MKYLILAFTALALCSCHYKYDYDMVLKGEGGIADVCPKNCKCAKKNG